MTSPETSPVTAAQPGGAEAARRAHSTVSALRRALLVWYALLGSIAAWAIHLLVLTSLVQLSCNTGGVDWAMHLTTAVTLVMTALAMVLSARLAASPGDPASVAEGGRLRFIGQLGLVIGAFNFVLIAVEEALVFAFDIGARCG